MSSGSITNCSWQAYTTKESNGTNADNSALILAFVRWKWPWLYRSLNLLGSQSCRNGDIECHKSAASISHVLASTRVRLCTRCWGQLQQHRPCNKLSVVNCHELYRCHVISVASICATIVLQILYSSSVMLYIQTVAKCLVCSMLYPGAAQCCR